MPSPLRRTTLATKLGAIGAVLLLLALASIGLTLWVTWQLEGGAAAVNEAGRLRMQTWRLAQAVDRSDIAHLQAQARSFDESLALLKSGDPSRPLVVPQDEHTVNAFAAVQSHWLTLRAAWLGNRGVEPVLVARQADAMVAHIDRFVSAIEHRLSTWTTVLTAFQLGLMGLAIAGGVTLLYAAFLFVFNPLARLQSGLARLEQGDLAARVDVESRDEFGALADGFNRMAAKLQAFTRGLEERVREKTESLHAERERLAALYEASASVAHSDSLQTLAQVFVRQVRRVAKADAAMLRWADAEHQRYALLASDCLPQEMLEEERCLDVGNCHCGQAEALAGTRIIPILSNVKATTCERHGFAHVASVPVRLHEQVLGEIDLLYRGEVTLTDDDRALLDTLGAHLASGMESHRASALEREAAVSEERGLLARELHDSIAQSLAFLKIQAQLLRDAMKKGDKAATERTLAELDAGIKESTADVRELLVHFRTRTNSEDIVPALKTTLQKFQHQTGLPTHLNVQGHGVPLPADVQVQVLHVVQEALSNVRKHAQARQVWLDVQQQPAWRIEVRDDGRGFAPAGSPEDQTHVGLRIMRERAATIGADVQVQSVPGAGTKVAISLPERQAMAA